MKFPGVDPIFDYRFTAINTTQTKFSYSVSTKYRGPITRYFMIPLMLSVINGRLSRSHPYLKTLIEEKSSPIVITPARLDTTP